MAYAKFNPDKSDIIKKAIEHNGNISKLAVVYNVHRDTIYEYLKRDPEGKWILEKVRAYNTEFDLDLAEYVHRYNMSNYKTSPGLAQRAAEKIIDKKGHLRGYHIPAQEASANESKIDYDLNTAKLNAEIAELKRMLNESKTGTEHLRGEQTPEHLVRSSQIGEDIQ